MEIELVRNWIRRVPDLADSFGPCLLALFLLFSMLLPGCQNGDDSYQVITEDMNEPETESVAAKVESKTTEPQPEKIVEESPRETPPVKDSTVNKTEMPQKDELPEESVSTEKPAVVADTPPSDSSSEKPAAGAVKAANEESVNVINSEEKDLSKTFVSVQAEMDRKKREALLGLGEKTESGEPREIKLLVKDREFSQDPEHGAWRVTFDDIDLLKILNMEPVPVNAIDYLPDWLTALEGEKIVLRGWMYPNEKAEGIKGFVFVRDNQICCFGREAKVYDKLTVRLKSGQTTKYIEGRPFDVVGTLRIDPWIEPNRNRKTGEFVDVLEMLFHLEDATVLDN